MSLETKTPHMTPSNSGDTLTTQVQNPYFWQTGPLGSTQIGTFEIAQREIGAAQIHARQSCIAQRAAFELQAAQIAAVSPDIRLRVLGAGARARPARAQSLPVAGFLFSQDILRIYQDLKLPVWFSHGVRGDFVDYTLKTTVEGRPNWTVTVFQTGAMPHFEVPGEFMRTYDEFLARVTRTAA